MELDGSSPVVPKAQKKKHLKKIISSVSFQKSQTSSGILLQEESSSSMKLLTTRSVDYLE